MLYAITGALCGCRADDETNKIIITNHDDEGAWSIPGCVSRARKISRVA